MESNGKAVALRTNLKNTSGPGPKTAEEIISHSSFKIMKKSEVITWIKKLGEKVADTDAEIKQCALQCLAHARAHGDVTLLHRLLDVLPRGRWEQGFKQWVYSNSPVRANPKTGEFYQAKEGENGYRPYNLEAAAESDPIPKARPEGNKADRIFNLLSVQNLIRGLQGRVTKAEDRNELVQADKVKINRLIKAVNSVPEMELKPAKVVTDDTILDQAKTENLAKAKAAPIKKVNIKTVKPRAEMTEDIKISKVA